MGPQAAVNAVYKNKIDEVPEGAERDAFVRDLRERYRADIDIEKLASELVVDAIKVIRALHPYDEPLINIIPLANHLFEKGK